MFSITFTKDQAEQFIHGIFQKNFRDNPEFIVRISDEELKVDAKDEAEVNPWLVSDADGWFTHDPDWKSEQIPSYIEEYRRVAVILREDSHGHSDEGCSGYAKYWNWSADGGPNDIIKWKYAE